MALTQVPAASVSPNYTLLNPGGTTLTGSRTITISGISGKNNIYLWAIGVSCAGSTRARISIRLNTDTGTNYYYAGFRGQPTNTVGSQNGNEGDYFLMGNLDRDSTNNYFAVEIAGANSSGIKTIQSVGGVQNYNLAGEYNMVAKGHYSGSSAITSISLYTPEDGNFDAGTVYVYGA